MKAAEDWVRKTAKKYGLGLKQPFPPEVVVVPEWVGYWADVAEEQRHGAGSPNGLILCASKKHKSCKSTDNKRDAEAKKVAAKTKSEEKYKRKYQALKDENQALKKKCVTLENQDNEVLKNRYKKRKSV